MATITCEAALSCTSISHMNDLGSIQLAASWCWLPAQLLHIQIMHGLVSLCHQCCIIFAPSVPAQTGSAANLSLMCDCDCQPGPQCAECCVT